MSDAASASLAIRSRLSSLMEELGRARKQMSGLALARPEDMDSLALEMAAAGEEMGRVVNTAGFADLPEAERAALIRMASAVRTQLSMVAKLAAGGARYAAVLRGLERGPTPGTYGRAGMQESAPASRMERKV